MGRIEEAEKIAATLLQTYPSSMQANAIRDNQLRQTEFEVLREKYRQAQLDELQEGSQSNQIIAEPKIKVIRKKSPVQASNSEASIEQTKTNTQDD